MEIKGYPDQLLNEFTSDVDRIYLFWALVQIETIAKDLKNCLKFLENVDLTKLKEDQFQKYTQLVTIS